MVIASAAGNADAQDAGPALAESRAPGFSGGRMQVLTSAGAFLLLNTKRAYLATLKARLCTNSVVPVLSPQNVSSWTPPTGGGYADILLGAFASPVLVTGPFWQTQPALSIWTPSAIVTPGETIASYMVYDPSIVSGINAVVLYEIITTLPLPQWAPSGIPIVLQYLMQESQFAAGGFTP